MHNPAIQQWHKSLVLISGVDKKINWKYVRTTFFFSGRSTQWYENVYGFLLAHNLLSLRNSFLNTNTVQIWNLFIIIPCFFSSRKTKEESISFFFFLLTKDYHCIWLNSWQPYNLSTWLRIPSLIMIFIMTRKNHWQQQ